MAVDLGSIGSAAIGAGANYLIQQQSQSAQAKQSAEQMKQQYAYNLALQAHAAQFNALSQEKQNRFARELFQGEQDFNSKEAEKAYQRQREMVKDNAYLTRQGLAKAGLNVNFANGGFSPSASVNGASAGASAGAALGLGGSAVSPGTSMSSMPSMDLVQMYNQSRLASAESRKMNADAKAQEIENSRQETYDKNLTLDLVTDKEGTYIPNLDKWLSEHPNEQPVLQKTKFENKGSLDAWQSIQRWFTEAKELDSRSVKSTLESMVASGQIGNSEVAKSLIELPDAQFKVMQLEAIELAERAVKESKESGYIDFTKELEQEQWEMEKNTDVRKITEKISSGEATTKDYVQILLLSLLGLGNNTRFSVRKLIK